MIKLTLLVTTFLLTSFSFGQALCQADYSFVINGATIDFTNLSTGTNLTYEWDFGDGTTSNQVNPSHTYTQISDYFICLTVTDSSANGFCQDQMCDSLWISVGSGCTVSVQLYGDQNNMIIGQNTTTGSNTFLWGVYSSNGTFLHSSSTTDLSFGPVPNGTYSICLAAFDDITQMECDSNCFDVTIFDSTSSVFNLEQIFNFSIYPNPANRELTISIDNSSIFEISVSDIFGRKIETTSINGDATNIYIENYPNGIYIIHALDINGNKISSKKFVKK